MHNSCFEYFSQITKNIGVIDLKNNNYLSALEVNWIEISFTIVTYLLRNTFSETSLKLQQLYCNRIIINAVDTLTDLTM